MTKRQTRQSNPKRLTSIRIGDYTTAQVRRLAERLNSSQSGVITLAIDRMYRHEFGDQDPDQDTSNREETMTTATTTITLKRSQIEQAMLAGDTHDGAYYLIVPSVPSGPNDYRIRWYRSWGWNDPWGDDDFVVKIPALYPAGEGVEYESATELAERLLGREEARRWRDEVEESNASFVEAVKTRWPEQWQASEDDALDALLEEWLDELNDPATWERQDEYGMPVRRPHPAFEWRSWRA